MPRRSNCPISFALDLFGDRWSLLIIRDLMFKQRTHFKEFSAAGEGISTNILSNRLERLEDSGIIASEIDPDDARAKRYRLTQKGADLAPLLTEMIVWSAKHDPKTDADRAFVKWAEQDRDGLLAEVTKNLET